MNATMNDKMKTTTNNRLAFIGGGNMARGIIGGLISSGWVAQDICASDPSQTQRHLLEKQCGITTYASNEKAVSRADIVMLSVKPQVLKQAVASIRTVLIENNPLLISIVAGIKSNDILKWIGQELPFVRVMPNTPALVNCGVSGLLANAQASCTHKQSAQQVMQAVGQVIWVDSEHDMDTVTGISGSGPAYFFKLMEIMIKTAQSNGLDQATAKKLVLQTALGAAKLALHSEYLPDELRRQVTSPGGTTAAALQTMEQHDIDKTITLAINAAIKKSAELAKTLGAL